MIDKIGNGISGLLDKIGSGLYLFVEGCENFIRNIMQGKR